MSNATTAKKTAAAKSNIARAAAAPRVAPIIGPVSNKVPMPERKSRGGRSAYPFDTLGVGYSFPVKNKTAKQLASIVSAANKRGVQPKRDETGAIVYKTQIVKSADGSEKHVPTNVPETFHAFRFFVVETDPKSDPDGASARVFREA